MAELLSARVKDSACCSCDRIALGICPSLAVALQAMWTVRMSVEKMETALASMSVGMIEVYGERDLKNVHSILGITVRFCFVHSSMWLVYASVKYYHVSVWSSIWRNHRFEWGSQFLT